MVMGVSISLGDETGSTAVTVGESCGKFWADTDEIGAFFHFKFVAKKEFSQDAMAKEQINLFENYTTYCRITLINQHI